MNWKPGQPVQMLEDQYKEWSGRIERGEKFVEVYHPQFERSLGQYAKPKYPENRSEVNALIPYRHVETKKSHLFFGTPEVQLLPIDPADPQIDYVNLLPQRQKFLNHKLGLKGTKCKRALHKSLVDAMAASGWMVVKIGYENRTVSVPPDAGAALPTEASTPDVSVAPAEGAAPAQPIPVPVWERCFVSWVSGKKLIVPDDFHDTEYDESPWLAIKGKVALSQAKAMGWAIPEDFEGSNIGGEQSYNYDGDKSESKSASDPQVEYIECWYKAALYDPQVQNPDLYRCLIVVKGVDQPVKHVDSPYQSVDVNGRLTPDSMVGSPIHVGTLRDLPDSAIVPSDLTVGEQLSKEIDVFRTHLIRKRKSREGFNMIDPQGFPVEEVEKIKNGQRDIFTNPGELLNGRIPIVSVMPAGVSRDDHTAQDVAERDLDRALGISANQAGDVQKKRTTATETRIVQSNATARSETDKERVREYYVTLVEKLDAVLTRYATQEEVLKVLGQAGAQVWEQWRMLPGRYTYHILPDSGVYLDVQQMRAQALDDYNLLRKDPLIDPVKLLKSTAQKLGYPADMVLEAQPEGGPEPIKTSISFKGEDLIGPQSQAVVEILAQMGITISPGAINALIAGQQLLAQQQQLEAMMGGPDGGGPIGKSSAKHGGAANKTEPLNQHQTERTGGVQGVAA